LAGRLGREGWDVRLLHNRQAPCAIPTLSSLSYRQMGAVCAVADLIISVDTATFHWGGILGRPTIGVFNVNDGVTYCRYYPTARPVQTCPTPCINVRYSQANGGCPKHAREAIPLIPGLGLELSRCYGRATIDSIMETVHAAFPGDVREYRPQ
jgi:hypothetical protein